MATNLEDRETLDLWPEDADEQAFLEHLRANGVRLATGRWGGPYVLAKRRPWWLALIIRTLRKLRLYDD